MKMTVEKGEEVGDKLKNAGFIKHEDQIIS